MHAKNVLIARLAGRIDRLRDTLAALRTAVKDKVAEVVGQAVQDVVRETIRAALDRPAPPPVPTPAGRYDDEDDWDEEDGYGYGPHNPGGYREVSRHPTPAPPAPPSPPRLTLALAAGTRAAAWWLGRTPGQKNWGWVLAGLAAGGVTYALGPVAAALLPAVAALALADRAGDLLTALPI